MQSVLITGGAGFIGRNFTKFFLLQGFQVVVVDNLEPKGGGINIEDVWPEFDPRSYSLFKFINMDCREYFRVVSESKFDVVLHLAAVVGGREIIENEPYRLIENIEIDASLFKWAIETKPNKLILFSSSAVYPIKYQRKNDYRPLTEEFVNPCGDILTPDLFYGYSKINLERLAKIAAEMNGVKSVVYRPFSGYGEGQALSYPVPAICARALKLTDENQIKVWGSGNQMRDFIHIKDIVNMVASSYKLFENAEAINLSSGVYTSMKELAELAASICGHKVNAHGTTDKPEGVFARGGDCSLQRKIGLVPEITLKTGIKSIINHLREQDK